MQKVKVVMRVIGLLAVLFLLSWPALDSSWDYIRAAIVLASFGVPVLALGLLLDSIAGEP